MAKSHYLETDRLANVIAALQTMAVADRPSATLNRWVAELEASEELTSDQLDQSPIKFAERKKWQAVFEQHPEFFKTYTLRGEPRVLLRWRFSESIKREAKEGANGKASAEKPEGDAASSPLNADQIQVLINTAIEMHAKEVASERAPDHFRPLLMAIIGAALGTVAGGLIIVLLGLLQSGPAHRLFD
ncbi:hypothetical protein [Rhodoplanes sp. Z2-YC6860]|uniref:hypothetical protein n=1 Tax=Rhodoplanes sp. Z2-YC6860 TaxID=674703 RepID=UPI00078E1207|nr:hypothetical protein [Rhodoplanes sp. Z2-YC6860]AMN40957.1 hypothetical protein RHPLAN_25190 [Rhodoplanes sp. Z2-YC6860]